MTTANCIPAAHGAASHRDASHRDESANDSGAAAKALLRQRRDDWASFTRFTFRTTAAVAFILVAMRVFLV